MRTATMQMQNSCGVCHTTTANDLVRLGELGVVCPDCLHDAYQATAALLDLGYQPLVGCKVTRGARTPHLFLVEKEKASA